MAANASLEWLSPREVRFTQQECSPWFQDGTWLPELFMSVVSGAVRVGDVPPLRVYWYRGRRYSVDNRRLAVWRILHLQGVVRQVPVFQMRQAVGPSFFRKFSTRCEGEFILIRGVNLIVGTHCMFFLPRGNSNRIVYALSLGPDPL